MERLYLTLLELYDELKRICEVLNIDCFAVDGTLLGAIRHKGFIPWDDDMDFGMFREEYDVFFERAPKIVSDNFFIQTYKTDKYWYKPYIKIRKKGTLAVEPGQMDLNINHGISIDIFPFDKINSKSSKRKKELLRFICYLRLRRPRNISFKYRLVSFLSLIIFPIRNQANQTLYRLATKNNNKEDVDSFFCVYNSFYATEYVYNINLFLRGGFVIIPFENTTIKIPANFDYILSHEYGDYMSFPSEEKRKPKHIIDYRFDLN